MSQDDEIAEAVKVYVNGQMLKARDFRLNWNAQTTVNPVDLADPPTVEGILAAADAAAALGAFDPVEARCGWRARHKLFNRLRGVDDAGRHGPPGILPLTYMGLRVVEDGDLPPNVVRFVNCAGGTVREFHLSDSDE